MSRCLLRRLLSLVLVLQVAVTLSFALVHLLPGDPVELMRNGNLGGLQATPSRRPHSGTSSGSTGRSRCSI